MKLLLLPRAIRRLFLKATGGAGSRGGRVLGYTKNGRAIYANSGTDPKHHAGYAQADHGDAAMRHYLEARRKSDPEERSHHLRMSAYHHGEFQRLNREHWAKKSGRHLPEEHGRYFTPTPETVHLPVSDLQLAPRHEHVDLERSADNAERLMREAAEGKRDRRGPITVRRRPDGRHEVLDGQATWTVAQRHGWRTIPAVEEK